MKKANIRKLHARTGLLVDLATEELLRRAAAAAEQLRPASTQKNRRTLPDRRALLARFPKLATDSARFLEEDRS